MKYVKSLFKKRNFINQRVVRIIKCCQDNWAIQKTVQSQISFHTSFGMKYWNNQPIERQTSRVSAIIEGGEISKQRNSKRNGEGSDGQIWPPEYKKLLY